MTQENKNEILNAIHNFADQTERRFDKLETDASELKSDVSNLKSDVSNLKSDVASMKNQMVTKDFLEDKIADLRGDLVILTRREDKKVNALVEILQEKKLLNEEEVKKILSMTPFAQVS